MEAPLQQRIVGAIVLVTLGVIFIPALLDGSGYRTRQAQDIEVKEKPAFPPPKQKKLKAIETPLKNIKQSQKQALATDKKQPHRKPVKSFALQVGTFASDENAKKMRDELRKAGYTTYVKKVTAKGKTSYRVRIGPELEREKLNKLKAKLKKTRKIDSYIVNHL